MNASPIAKRRFRAIVDTLATSVQTGLNATLTPADCLELLTALRSAERKPDDWTTVLKRFADGVLDELNPPKRRKR